LKFILLIFYLVVVDYIIVAWSEIDYSEDMG